MSKSPFPASVMEKISVFFSLPQNYLFCKVEHEMHLKELLKKEKYKEIGAKEFEDLRPVFCIVKKGTDYSERYFPQESGLQRFVSFTKGCFVWARSYFTSRA